MNRLQRNGGFPFYYWFFAGLFVGILTGWFFHGTINFIFRLVLLVGVIAVIGLIIYLWQRGPRSDSTGTGASDIPEGTWRNIDPSGRK
ncbi:MAG TPA: hypothetical protein VFP05_08035 [Thermomicrobiales bacterium]|nr:hypothetical protein [Thermomicrobiales bacterium]